MIENNHDREKEQKKDFIFFFPNLLLPLLTLNNVLLVKGKKLEPLHGGMTGKKRISDGAEPEDVIVHNNKNSKDSRT